MSRDKKVAYCLGYVTQPRMYSEPNWDTKAVMELIERLQTTGPTTVRGLARELDRDVKRVHEDVSILIKHGLVARTADRKICVPYDVIHADFDLRAVA
jgi:predicted transcriptional regulator